MTRRSTNPYQKVRESARVLRLAVEHLSPDQQTKLIQRCGDMTAFKAGLTVLEHAGVIVPDDEAEARARFAKL